MQNPYITLLRTAWVYARHEKRQYILVYFLFILANIVAALRPLLFGWFVGQLQQQDTDIVQTGLALCRRLCGAGVAGMGVSWPGTHYGTSAGV